MKRLLWLLLPACSTAPPGPPTELAQPAQSISVARNHTVYVTDTGTIEDIGAPVPGPTDDNGNPLALGVPAASQVAVGKRHACVISVTGTVHCWGDQSHGALGTARSCTPPAAMGAAPDCVLPAAQITTLPPMRAIAAGDDVTCAITMDDHVICWGAAGPWLGRSIVPALDPPVPVMLPKIARLVIAGGDVCAIDREDVAWCWGADFTDTPAQQPYSGIVDIALGRTHSCVIAADGLTCWGSNRNGESGDLAAAHACGNTACTVDPTHIALDATRVVVGERHTCALTTTGEVACWGSNEVGQLGHDDAFLLGDIGVALDGAVDVVAGYAHTCARRRDGSGWCWGSTDKTDPNGGTP